MTKDLKTLFAARSNEAWRDAHAPEEHLSLPTRLQCLFDAGYFALLGHASSKTRERVSHHPDPELVRTGCAAASLPSDVGVRFAENEGSPFDADRPSREELTAWASEVRAKLL